MNKQILLQILYGNTNSYIIFQLLLKTTTTMEKNLVVLQRHNSMKLKEHIFFQIMAYLGHIIMFLARK